MPRTGKGTKAHPQRTDLNTAAPTGEDREFGANKADQDALDQLPLEPQAAPGPLPGDLGPLTGPSNRPDEPITAGVGVGAGPGPESRYIKPEFGYRTPLEKVAEMTQNPRLQRLVRNLYG